MENVAADPPVLPLSALPGADFPDGLSPMLVKELRQGVRTRVFVSIFILLQVFMLLNLVLSLLVASTGVSTSEGTSLFWLMVSVPTLLVIPFSGLNAIGSEVRGNTLELLLLTRLTAFRIVVGKWSALFAQSVLLVCAVLPYLVLRYFMGGVNLASELLLLGTVLVSSAVLTAIAVGLSAFSTRAMRPVLVIASIFVLPSGLNIVFGSFFLRGRMFSSLPDLVQTGTTLICAAILILLMLDVGAARIAPLAENRSAAMRFLAFAGLLVAMIAQAFSHRFVGVTVGAFVVAFIVCAVAVCEQPRAIPSLYRPFARWGWPGRIAGRFFYPGWHTGVLYLLGMFAAFGALLAHEKMIELTDGARFTDQAVWFVALTGAMLLPVALMRGFFRGVERAAAFFVGVQAVCLVLAVCLLICDATLRTSYRDFVAFLPVCTLLSGPASSQLETTARLIAVSATTLVSLVVLVVASVPAFRQTSRLERESLALPTPPENTLQPDPPAVPHAPLA